METRRDLRGPRCGLCLTCANLAPPGLHKPDRRRAMECLAGSEPRGALVECPSYVRVFTRAPDVPARYGNRNARGSSQRS
jgi:hypothetical protein